MSFFPVSRRDALVTSYPHQYLSGMFHVKHCRLCWNLCAHNKTIFYYVPRETSLSCDRSSAQSIELYRERRSLTSAKHKRGGFRYLTTRTVAFHTVSRDTYIYLGSRTREYKDSRRIKYAAPDDISAMISPLFP